MGHSESTLTKITQSIIANQVAYDFNHKIRFTGYYKRELKNKINLLDKELLKAEKNEFEMVFENAEFETQELHKVQTDMIKEIASVGIDHFEVITEIVKALKKDPKRLNSIVRKINSDE